MLLDDYSKRHINCYGCKARINRPPVVTQGHYFHDDCAKKLTRKEPTMRDCENECQHEFEAKEMTDGENFFDGKCSLNWACKVTGRPIVSMAS